MQWSGANRPYGDSRAMWVGVEAWISSSNDTQAWIAVRACACSGSGYDAAYGYGIVTQAGHAAIANRPREWNEAGRGVLNGTDWVADGTITYGPFDRYSSAYNVTCWGKAWGDTVNGYGGWAGSAEVFVTVTVPAMPVYAPPAVTSVSNVRNSDSQNTVAWANHADATHPYASLLVERQIDGGSWSQIASLSGSATSYADAGAQANHAYAYRVRPYNAAGYGAYATSGTTYNTPAAPTSIAATRSGSATVALAIDNPALTATALDIQRSTDGTAWASVATVTGSAVASATDTPGGGTFYYRARNTRGSLVSAWSPASNAVVTIVAPAAPTLLSPASGVTIAKTQAQIVFGWRHNPIDGSSQTAAQLQHSTDGGTTWTTVALSTAQTYTLANSFAVNATVTWRVRTKGAHADYGAYSASQAFKVCQVPSAAVTAPAADGTVINDVPIAIAWSYADQSGTQRQAVVTIKDAAGSSLWSKAVAGAATSVSVPSSELLPANNATFSVEVAVTSTSSLTATATRTFATDYEEPANPGLSVEVDEVHGSVALVVYEGQFETATLMNLITNGDFSKGTVGYNVFGSTINVDSGECTMIATAQYGRTYQAIPNQVAAHKRYHAALVKAGSNLVGLGYGYSLSLAHSGSGEYELLSVVSSDISGTTYYPAVVDARTSAWDAVKIKFRLAIDLTAAFGAGNEPSAAEMDALLAANFENSWFDGTITLYRELGESKWTTRPIPATASLGIFRRGPDGSLTSLADKVGSGTGVTDVYPPLDADGMAYVAVAYTGNGLTATTERPTVVPSDGAVFLNFGASLGYADVAKADMDVEWETKTEVDSEVIETEGDEDPLVFYGVAKRIESSVTGNVWWREATVPVGWGDEANMAAAFERLAADVGIKVVRYPHGPVVPSDVTCSVKVSSSNPLVAAVDISARRVRADGLVI